MQVQLSTFDNSGYSPGAGIWKRVAWYLCNALLMDSWWLPSSQAKRWLLNAFGARIGRGVVIKPRVNIKYPWLLAVGEHSWIGEGVWIDNLAQVTIASNVCISQGARLLTGNHDYRDPSFGLIVKEIAIDEGAWIGAFTAIVQGVKIARFSVLSVGSIALTDTEEGWVYRGSPAAKVRQRFVDAECRSAEGDTNIGVEARSAA